MAGEGCRRLCGVGLRLIIGFIALLAAIGTWASAQDFPGGPVRLLVGFPAGGSTDLVARDVASELEKTWGHAVVVENRGGANGGIAAVQLARTPADGKSLMLVVSGHVTNPLMTSDAGYDAIKDFTPISLVGSAPLLIFAHPTFPANNIRSLIELGREKPGTVSYSTPGVGSIHHLSMELMGSLTGARFTHIPYRGGGPALNDALAGHVPVSMLSIVQALPHIEAKRIVPLAVTSPRAAGSLPGVPAVSEIGIPNYEAELWYAVLAPAGLSPAIADKINTDITRAVKSAAMQKRFEGYGILPIGSTRAELGTFLQSEIEKWRRVIASTGIRAN